MTLTPWRNKQKKRDLPVPRAEYPLQQLRGEMERIFSRFSRGWGDLWEEPFSGMEKWVPFMDIAESEKEVTVKAEVPGVDPKNLDVSLSGNLLTISGEKKESNERKDETCYRSECYAGSFNRSIKLPASVDPEKIKAEYANGILTIAFKKLKADKIRHIKVKEIEL